MRARLRPDRPIDFLADQPPLINLLVFVAGAAVIWTAGRSATQQARRIADRFRLGDAFVGMLLLGIVTSLPEVATTASAARIGAAPLAGSNLLGGVALQMALLAVIDGLVPGGRSLTAAASRRKLAAQAGPPIFSELGPAEIAIGGIDVALVLALIAGLQMRSARSPAGLGPEFWAMLLIYGAGLVIVYLVS